MKAFIFFGFIPLILSGMVIYEIHQQRMWRRLADNRLRVLRKLILLFYLHKHQSDVFLRKFGDEIHVVNLKDTGIVPHKMAPKTSNFKETELFLYGLIKAGFTQKELCAIFNLSNINSFTSNSTGSRSVLAPLGSS